MNSTERKFGIKFDCIPPVTKTPEENLAFRTAVMFKKFSPKPTQVDSIIIKIKLKKNIPPGAGLGGGSSDAACILNALNRLWGSKLDKKALLKIAIQLGSDVGYFLYGGLCLVEGRGDKITPIKNKLHSLASLLMCDRKSGVEIYKARYSHDKEPPYWVVLIYPGFSISTKDIYSYYDEEVLKKMPKKPSLSSQPTGEDKKDNLEFINDLEQVVFRKYPELKKLKSELIASGAIAALMSGSGPTIFGIFRNKHHAEDAIEKFNKKSPKYNIWLVKPVDMKDCREAK